jgi:c-di-GMP-binding flagellar brake protein YcgR
MAAKEGSLTPDDFARPVDVRREVRVSARKPIQILPCKAAHEWRFVTAELTDCSMSGIGLLVEAPLAVGEQFLVKFKLHGVALLQYTVRHCSPAEGGRHKVGAEFTGLAATPHEGDRQPILDALLAPE